MNLFTCARPGRSKGPTANVEDKILDEWVRNLPGPHTVIVSLLGTKPDRSSEYSFYSFYPRKTFQAWLDRRHGDLSLEVIDHPTTDFKKIPPEVLKAATTDIIRLLEEGRTVVVIDSGGETRTGQLCRYLGLVEDSRQL
jgi:hypothetical protein